MVATSKDYYLQVSQTKITTLHKLYTDMIEFVNSFTFPENLLTACAAFVDFQQEQSLKQHTNFMAELAKINIIYNTDEYEYQGSQIMLTWLKSAVHSQKKMTTMPHPTFLNHLNCGSKHQTMVTHQI